MLFETYSSWFLVVGFDSLLVELFWVDRSDSLLFVTCDQGPGFCLLLLWIPLLL